MEKNYPEKIYLNISAYKSRMDELGCYCGIIMFFSFCLFFGVCSIFDLWFLIGVGITALIWIWYLLKLIKNKSIPNLILVQRNEGLYIFPDTDKQIVISLKDIKETKKKKFIARNFIKSSDGKLTMITETNIYKLNIANVNTIYSRIKENIEIYKSPFEIAASPAASRNDGSS